MIKTRTVFVLGAGASMPYGFPSGAQLRTEICSIGLNGSSMKLGRQLLDLAELSSNAFKSFGEAFSRSSIASIDSFLAKRPHYMEVGKVLIAGILCERERPVDLFSDARNDHWYKLLWNALLLDAEQPSNIAENAVRFITFNYDRSLEYFLHEAIKHTFGLNDGGTMKVTDRLRITHVYGSIGTLAPEPRKDFRTYGERLSESSLRAATEGIHVIPEDRSDSVFEEVRKDLTWAQRICFLGFGFDPLNMRRLKVDAVLTAKRAAAVELPVIYATTLGRTGVETVEDRRRLLGERADWEVFNMANSDALRNTPLLFS
jgi:hypothetical protein